MIIACFLSIPLVCGLATHEKGQGLGILVMAHGGDTAWNDAVKAAVAPLREKYPTEIAFGMARTSTIKTAVDRLEASGVSRIAVVRMFISGDSFLNQTQYILGLRDAASGLAREHNHLKKSQVRQAGHLMEAPQPIQSKALFFLSRGGVGDSPLVNNILVDRVKALSQEPSRESVLLLAHGPADEAENERWLANMHLRVQGLHELGAFKHIQCETLREDWPQRRTEAERRIRRYVTDATENGGRCIVIPFRVAGFGPYRDVLRGLDYIADGKGFCPHPLMTQWLERAAHLCWSMAEAVPHR